MTRGARAAVGIVLVSATLGCGQQPGIGEAVDSQREAQQKATWHVSATAELPAPVVAAALGTNARAAASQSQVLVASYEFGINTDRVLAFARAGDHILVVDTCYRPTRQFCDEVLMGMGIEVGYYDPNIGAGIQALLRAHTRLIYTESPGSQTFEVQDIPAIAMVARARDIWLLMDNTWATPCFFKPFQHGVDVSIHAGTKYIVGHADAMLGVMTANERAAGLLQKGHWALGSSAGSEEVFLGLRGLRTLEVRLLRHQASAIEMAIWLKARPEVEDVLHPALPTFPGHDLWRRDFTGSSGLFSIVLKQTRRERLAAMLDGLRLFGMGYSWGGFESLAVPFDPAHYRTATRPRHEGRWCIRLHIGLEAVADLKADLEAGFQRLTGGS